MARRGPVRIPDLEAEQERDLTDQIPEEVILPSAPVLEAGINKFYELANLHWPKNGESISFDMKNVKMLRITLGLVYAAMRQAERP